MPIQAPAWTEFLTCPVCCNEFDGSSRSPISLACSHTVCKACLQNLHKKQCPFDQTVLKSDVKHLPVNSALLELVGGEVGGETSGSVVPVSDRAAWTQATTAVRRLAAYLRPGATALSRPMQRKLVALVNCQLAEEEGRGRAMRAARSLGDRTVTELILHHQNPQHLSANLWAAVRARGCQFLGPAMQEEVLKLVLLALEDGSALSRKVLVMFVVQRLEPHFPQASKTSIGHVVQLLYRASSFKVSKREGDSSLMQLKEEFRSYEALRREHDAQIVQIATEAGLRIAPDQWSALLYGDSAHKSHMQSIVDKLQTPGAFAHSIEELVIALQRTNDPGRLSQLRPHLDHLAHIDPNPESGQYSMSEVARGLDACRNVVAGLVDFMRNHGAATKGGSSSQNPVATACSGTPTTEQPTLPPALGFKYKVSLCRDLMHKGNCPRGSSCTFAHSNDELDKFRAKNRKPQNRNIISSKEDDNSVDNIFFSEGNGDYGYPISSSYPSTHHMQQPITPNLSPTTFPSYHQGESPPYKSISGGGGVCYHGEQVMGVSYPPENAQVATVAEPTQPSQIPQPRSKQPLWRSHSLPNKKMHGIGSGLGGSNWALLQHRRQELLNHLERVEARCNNNTILPNEKVDYSTSRTGGVSTANNYSVWNIINTNIVDQTIAQPLEQTQQNYLTSVYCRGESVVSEEEFIPFDPPVVSKFGPISRDSGGSGLKTEDMRSSPGGTLHQVGSVGSLPSSTYLPPSHWLYAPQQHTQPTQPPPSSQPIRHNPAYGHGQVMVDPSREGYMSVSPTSTALDPIVENKQIHNSPPTVATSKEFLAESQKMKQQLKTLEKRINDLKLASNGVALAQGEKLTQELHLIEQGIIEKEKLLGLSRTSNISTLSSLHDSTSEYKINERGVQEDSYEAGIANDIRELELRWQFELEEQEKRWSSEEECNKK